MSTRVRRRFAHWLRALAQWVSPDKAKITVKVTGAGAAVDAIERARLAIARIKVEGMRPWRGSLEMSRWCVSAASSSPRTRSSTAFHCPPNPTSQWPSSPSGTTTAWRNGAIEGITHLLRYYLGLHYGAEDA